MGNTWSWFNEEPSNSELPVANPGRYFIFPFVIYVHFFYLTKFYIHLRNTKGMVVTSKYKDFESKATIRKIQAIMRSYLASKKKHDNLIEKAKNLKLINSNTGKLNQETGVGNLNTLQDAHGM